jgi:hypothetical protein
MSENLKAILAELRSRFEEIYGDRLIKMVLFGSQSSGDTVQVNAIAQIGNKNTNVPNRSANVPMKH